MATIPNVTHSVATLTGGVPKLWLEADEDEARLAGLRLTEIAGQLDASLEGAVGGSILEGTEEMPIRVRVPDAARASLDDIAGQRVLAAGQSVEDTAVAGTPLAALGRLEMRPALGGITRSDGARVNTVNGYIQAGILPQSALNALAAALERDPIDLPQGYRIEFGGEAAERDEAIGHLMANVGLLVILMLATVVLSFNSFRLAGVIFTVAVMSMGLGLLSLFLLGYPLGFNPIIATMGLVGLAINAAIIILSELRREPAAADGDPEAMLRVVVDDSSRHIIATTITTMGGFLPLFLTQGGFWPPFAAAIAGGTGMATLVSFYFVPAAYLLLVRGKRRRVHALEPQAAIS